MSSKAEIPPKKLNYFYVFNNDDKKYNEVKYLTQQELADGWSQKVPTYNNKKLINHFSVTLAFLPEPLWKLLNTNFKNVNETYQIINSGMTKYTIIETNQDDTMKQLYNEIHKNSCNTLYLQNLINELDTSQHISWLVLRANHIITHNRPYFNHNIKL